MILDKETFHGRFFGLRGQSHWGLRTCSHCGNGSCRVVCQVLEYQGPEKVCRDVLLSCGCYLCDLYICTDSPGFFTNTQDSFQWQVGDVLEKFTPPPKNLIRQGYFHLWPSRKNWIDRTQEAKAAINGLDGHMLQGRRFSATKMWREKRTQTETSGRMKQYGKIGDFDSESG